jgi:hypothetical protein
MHRPGNVPIRYRTYEPDRLGYRKEDQMLWTVAVILSILWLLGLVSSHTMGGFIHILLVIAIIVVLVRVIQGRRIV